MAASFLMTNVIFVLTTVFVIVLNLNLYLAFYFAGVVATSVDALLMTRGPVWASFLAGLAWPGIVVCRIAYRMWKVVVTHG